MTVMDPSAEVPGAGEELSAEQQQHAVSLILGFCALNQVCRLYDINNELVAKVLREMERKVRLLADSGEGAVSITAAGHSFFLNRHLVRIGFSEYKKAKQLKQIWGKLGVGEVVFPGDVTFDGLQQFARKFVDALRDPAQVPELLRSSWGGVRARAVMGGDSTAEAEEPESYELGVRIYCGLLMLVQQTLAGYDKEQWTTLVQIKRTLQVMVEKLQTDEELLLALAWSAALHRDLARHLVNTALFTLILGRRLELSRRALISLATAALFHDLPKRGMPPRTLNSLERPGKVTPENRARIHRHWLATLRQMVKTGGFKDETLVRLVVAYESQLEFVRTDLYSGAVTAESDHALFSELVALGDQLDTLVWPREGKKGRSPHRAVVALASLAGRRFDAGLVRLLVDAVGLYPVGSLVQLENGAVAVVTRAPPEGSRPWPRVTLVLDPDGSPCQGPELDLAAAGNPAILRDLPQVGLPINTVVCFTGGEEEAVEPNVP